MVVLAVYGGWAVLTWNFNALPWWVVLPLGGGLFAWHGSLQHEILHGHPTRWRLFNQTLALPPLGLWMPYPIYRDSHLRHHRTGRLTCPFDDPESYYVTDDQWRRMSPPVRGALVFNNTLSGRLTLGPAITLFRFWGGEFRRLLSGEQAAITVWLGHGLAVALVLYWLIAVCGISFWSYVVLMVYPGLSLTLMRSFAEHRPADEQNHRTAIVEADPLTRLLYLNLNLHVVHHEQPGLPWYDLPAAYRADRQGVLQRNGGYLFAGYGEMARRFFFMPRDLPVLPAKVER
jgi:fatty acid desaturase